MKIYKKTILILLLFKTIKLYNYKKQEVLFLEETIRDKLAFSIKKYNSQTRKTNFIDDLNLIKSQNIVYEIENFYVDFEMENDAKIDVFTF